MSDRLMNYFTKYRPAMGIEYTSAVLVNYNYN